MVDYLFYSPELSSPVDPELLPNSQLSGIDRLIRVHVRSELGRLVSSLKKAFITSHGGWATYSISNGGSRRPKGRKLGGSVILGCRRA